MGFGVSGMWQACVAEIKKCSGSSGLLTCWVVGELFTMYGDIKTFLLAVDAHAPLGFGRVARTMRMLVAAGGLHYCIGKY